MRLVVLKLGGSLLACVDLAARLHTVLSRHRADRILIAVGGGESADVVREWSRRFELTEEAAHWIALRSLAVTRALVQALMPECGEVRNIDEAERIWREGNPPLLLDIEAYLKASEVIDSSPLPHTWNVTSDSIAAWVALRWDADELVLLKSTELPAAISANQAQQVGLIDDHFPLVAGQLSRVSWCNLTVPEPRIKPWLRRGIFDKG